MQSAALKHDDTGMRPGVGQARPWGAAPSPAGQRDVSQPPYHLPAGWRWVVCFVCVMVLCGGGRVVMGAEPATQRSAKVVDIDGQVTVARHNTPTWQPLLAGQLLQSGDNVRTGAHSRVSLLLEDESLIKLKEGSEFTLGEVAPNAGWTLLREGKTDPPSIQSIFELKKGGAWFLNKNRAVVIALKTPRGVIGVRGTELGVQLKGAETESTLHVATLEGQAHIENDQGEMTIKSGEEGIVRPGMAPTRQRLLAPAEAVQWTITFPPLVTPRDMHVTRVHTQAGWDALNRGRLEEALSHFERVANPDATDRLGQTAALIALKRFEQAMALLARARRRYPTTDAFALQQAWLDLMTGRIVQAEQVLKTWTTHHPKEPMGWQLRALVALVLDRQQEIEAFAGKATELGADSPTSWIIQAYIHQAKFRLDRAEEAAQKALDLDPEHVTALMTLAKLQFGSGRTNDALQTIERAARVAPQHAEVHSLNGFILFSLRRVTEAITAFEKAAKQDTALSEPHMGLGLSFMRQGDTARALEEITTAVLLDPRRSLLRSYWAKWLHQVGRHHRALDVLRMAKTLDPNDPTPALYEALILKDLNRPTEAIHAIHAAIRLNDHRAVYRSRFLLDGDLAVKNVDLATLFERLNLAPWAKNKAAASIRQDYTNASGHLFYGSALSQEGGRDMAANTEHLHARLLMPANLNSFNTFNTYTTFVEKPAIDLSVSTRLGNQRALRLSQSVVGAVPEANLAYIVGYETDRTDGWREAHFDKTRALAGYAKWDGPENGGLYVTASLFESEQGDRAQPRNEYESVGEPRDRYTSEGHRVEVGYHHHVAPGSDLLLHLARRIMRPESIGHLSANVAFDGGELQNGAVDSFLTITFNQIQLEYIHTVGSHQLLAGASHYFGNNHLKRETKGEVTLFDFFGPNQDLSLPNWTDGGVDVAQKRFMHSWFVKDIWQLLPDVTLETDLHFDTMETGDLVAETTWNLNEWTPRLGVVWAPDRQHTVRAAVFRALAPLGGDRIDPADIVGIPIHRSHPGGTRTDEAQLVWEYEWDQGLVSASLFYLDGRYPNRQPDGRMMDKKSINTGVEMVYNQLLDDGLGLSSRYRFQDVRQHDPSNDRGDHLWKTSLAWVRSDGWSTSLQETFRYLDFRVRDQENETIWSTDWEVAYEFPKKAGLLRLQAKNLFNQHFNWVEDTFTPQPLLDPKRPARELFVELEINF